MCESIHLIIMEISMDFMQAKEEYTAALRRGQKEYREMIAAGKAPNPAVLDDLLDDAFGDDFFGSDLLDD